MSKAAEQTALTDVTRRLALEFPEVMPTQVEAAVSAAHARFDQRPIRDFLFLFVEKHARHRVAHIHMATSA
ncbi:hypothetical protein H7J87_15380 [Mycolicibacterium wolinskyi]|uniref:Uncharacterized protein n=1 Tax=Mycolicibacterium wolinskyi TaxID=59750 RepID=A0A1X2F821_9MYCO|nr:MULTISPECIES: hypothetical protein [Mycolicibacterium]MCV7286709.1 hypothetical protein [Mycolicibacterium wolinskyi]MCV7293689.1 hypothetical protein [Mycolicibacterium goodii]ORX14591.1 hypothetical protein AWC31_25755 [Mycolicibacterium wolinskyi]